MSSPLLVGWYEDSFTVDGWLAIGDYDFGLYDGFVRSLYFFFMTLPTILVCYIFRPRRMNIKFSSLRLPFVIRPLTLFFFMGLYLVAFYFQLGMNGVETIAPFKLSGIVYYLRAYVLFLIVAAYILQVKEPSVYLVALYALVAGFTSASRFIAVLPLILLLMRHLLASDGRLGVKGSVLVVFVALIYFFITFARIPFYEESFELSLYWHFLGKLWGDDYSFFGQGFFQLFLRLGIGRDVILAYEVMESGNCTSLMGLLLGTSSCADPPYDFYGLALSSHKFYLGNPQLSSLVVLTPNPFIAFAYAIIYAFVVGVIFTLARLIRTTMFAAFLQGPFYLLLLIFVGIGPILYAWYAIFVILLLVLLNAIIKLCVANLKVSAENRRP